jgi:rhodanese-related sulfurtransferase
VRLPEDYAEDRVVIPGALYRNPEDIASWSGELRADAEIVVCCVTGKWVSQKAAHYLLDKGMHIESLEGGIEAGKQKAGQLHADRP